MKMTTTKLNEFAWVCVGGTVENNAAPVSAVHLTKEGDIIVNTAKLKDIILIEKGQ